MGSVLDLTKKRPAESSLPGEPPCAARSEELVIEAVLVIPGLLQRISPPLTHEHFFIKESRLIFEAIQQVSLEGGELNSLSVMNWLRLKKKDGGIKPEMLRTRAIFSTTEQSQVMTAAKTVFELAQERDLIRLCQETAKSVLDRDIESHQKVFMDFGSKTTEICRSVMRGKDTVSGQAAAKTAIDKIMNRSRDPGVLTGIRGYDNALGPMLPGHYTLIGGATGEGKTAWGLTVAGNVALTGNGVLYVAVADMKHDELMLRLVCAWAGVPARKVLHGTMLGSDMTENQENEAKIMFAAPKANGIALEIDDTPDQSIQEISALVPRVRAKFERQGKTLKLVILDYMQKIGFMHPKRGASEEHVLREISQGAKDIAERHAVHVLGLAQSYSADPKDKNSDGRPSIFANCKAMQRPAETVGFIHRLKDGDGKYPARGKAEIVIRKARWGARSIIRVVFDGPLTRFEDDPDEYVGDSYND